jgi:hypothetical protein
MAKIFHPPKTPCSAKTHQLISRIKDAKKRNLLRGYSSKHRINPSDIDEIRKKSTSHDIKIIGAILKSTHGLLEGNKNNQKKKSNDLFHLTSISPLSWKQEVGYTVGYINSEIDSAIDLLHFIKTLSPLEKMDTNQALGILLSLSKKYGASNFLSYKLAYIRSTREPSATSLELITQIEDEICHRENPGLHFSALENLSPKISLFQVAQRRVSTLVGRVDGDFRKAVTLSNFIPTPLDEKDSAGFLLRATESCLLDTVYSILIIFNLSEWLGPVRQELELNLDKKLLNELYNTIKITTNEDGFDIITEYYKTQNEESVATLDSYRTSAAFLERPKFTTYRNNLDRVIGARLISEIFNEISSEISPPLDDKKHLLSPNDTPQNEDLPTAMDTFYRTYLFLRFISERVNLLTLSKSDVKFLFENTIELEMLLSEEEMRALYDTSPKETKSLVAVLALALFRKKSIDPDVDFDFRTDFIFHVNEVHNGSIVDFINDLLDDSPQIASYILGSLDEVTLEKMYTLVTNSSQASEIRCDILRTVGQRLNRIEYIIEADAITTRSKVSKLQKYFDSSRMYVDSVSMKKWLDSNPTVSTEQYRSLFPSIEARNKSGILVLQINDQSEYLITQVAKDAFEQFCLNTEFGIQSYLGRRIRHNTLDGVTTDTVDAVLRKTEYRSIMSSLLMRRTVDAWMTSYKAIIAKLRRDHLQFKPSGSLFSSTLDMEDSITKENIRKLSHTLRTAGSSELLNDLIIAFCWRQITPQLESASRFIKTNLLKEANASIEKSFSGFGALEAQMKAELHEAVNEVFRKVADWFQVPQTGFISASIKDLCQIILIELNRPNSVDFSGNAVDLKYTGISVHRLYDCLAVLLQNGHKHGDENTRISVNARASSTDPDSLLEMVEVDITSTVSEENYLDSKQRIYKAIDAAEAGTDMVTEGYTGIKKVKFITRTSESTHTVRFVVDDETRQLKLGFSMHMETVSEDEKSESPL